MSALLYTALARLTRCFWPPLRLMPCRREQQGSVYGEDLSYCYSCFLWQDQASPKHLAGMVSTNQDSPAQTQKHNAGYTNILYSASPLPLAQTQSLSTLLLSSCTQTIILWSYLYPVQLSACSLFSPQPIHTPETTQRNQH